MQFLKILEENSPLKPYNTFGIEVFAAHFLTIDNVSHLQTLLKAKALPQPLLFLGGGSNLYYLLKIGVELFYTIALKELM